ncbi:hypothetical protein MKX01_016780 [Papaver californicum]|nr:hypothetical protein MKX01_016780 [Papaver californicum]
MLGKIRRLLLLILTDTPSKATEIKTPKKTKKPSVKIDYFGDFMRDSRITEKDVQDVNDYIHEGLLTVKLCLQFVGSCGVYALKYVEYLIRGVPLSCIKKEYLHRYRCEIAVQLFKKESIKVNIFAE